MEPPPLEVLPLSGTGGSLAMGNLGTVASLSPEGTGAIAVLAFGIFLLIDLPESARRSAKAAASIDDLLAAGDAWIPTVILSREAASQLTSAGNREVVLEPGFRKLPDMRNRERTVFLENWYRPIRNWYNREVSPFDYGSWKDRGFDAVLEVGLLNYSIYQSPWGNAGDSHMILQVLLKLVDPSTGRVLGRARSDAMDRPDGKEGYFDNGARRFKETFSSMGRKLMAEDLRKIGLLGE